MAVAFLEGTGAWTRDQPGPGPGWEAAERFFRRGS